MARIRPLKEEEVPPESRVHFQRNRNAFGTVLNNTGFYAYCPPVLDAATALGAAVEKSGLLPGQLRSLLNVRVASMIGCPF